MKKPTSCAARSLAALVTLLVLAFGCQDAAGPKLGYVPGGGDATVAALSFSAPFALTTGRRVMTWSGGATVALLALSTTTCSPGAELTIDIPASTATGALVTGDAHVAGDWVINASTHAVSNWDASKRNLLMLACAGSQVVGASRALDVLDAAAPTVVSATVSSDAPDKLAVVWSEPVVGRGVTTGLTLTVTSGTSRTITGLASGDNTSTTLFQLSGSFAGTETANFIRGSSRVLADYSGNLTATGTTAVTVSFVPPTLAAAAAWTRVWESGVAMTPTTSLPASLTAWTSQDGSSTAILLPGGGHPSRTAAPDAASHVTTADGSQRLTSPVVGTLGDFALFVRMKGDGDGTGFAGFDGNTSGINCVVIHYDGFNFRVEHDGNTIATSGDSAGGSGYFSVFASKVGSTWSIRQNAGTAATATDASSVAGNVQFFLGNAHISGPTEYEPGKFYATDAGFIQGRDFTSLERANILARIAAR